MRATFKAHEYGDVILPFVVLRSLDLVLEPQKDVMIEQFKDSLDEEQSTLILRQVAGLGVGVERIAKKAKEKQ